MSKNSEREQRDALAKDARTRADGASDTREASMLRAAAAQLNDDYAWKADEVRVYHGNSEHRFKVERHD
jgi:hypothetical protein